MLLWGLTLVLLGFALPIHAQDDEEAAMSEETASSEETAPSEETAASEETANEAQHYVDQIRFHGNDELGSGDLRDHMLTQAPPWYRFWARLPFFEDEIHEDMKRLVALYRQHGYYEATAEVTLLYSNEGPGVTIDIDIDEGQAVRLGSFRITLPSGGAPDEHELIDARKWRRLMRRLPLRENRVFRLGDHQASREAIRIWMSERGFPSARLLGSAEVDLPQHRASVEWTLVFGPRVRLGDVQIAGLEDVEEYIVQREIRLDPGEWYSPRAMARTRRRIQNLGLFRWTIVEALPPEDESRLGKQQDVVVKEDPGQEIAEVEASDPAPTKAEPTRPSISQDEETVWPVSVRVAERPPRRIRLGGGWGTDTSFRAELSWHHRNFFGGARHMDVGIRYSGLGAALRPTFMEPYLFGTRTRLLVSPGVVYENQDAYTARRILVDVQLQRDLIEHVVISGGYRFNRDDIFSVLNSPGEDELPEGVSITTGPNLRLSRSTLDNRLNARSGTLIELEAESSISAFASDEDFVRYTLDTRGFLEVAKTVLALRALLGTIQNHGNTEEEDIPLVERFYSGGSNSMRGFAYRSLSPEDANGDSVGGSSVIEGSFEWRIPVWGPIGIVGFLDAAQVDPDPWMFRVDDLRYAAGTGLRYTTPAGPLRVDFAWRLNPDDKRGKFRISASLGHTF
jgi:outer membrane protein assembly factor BamA